MGRDEIGGQAEMATTSDAAPPVGVGTHYKELVKENMRYKSMWEEISGSLGDLGTFVPIVIALTLVNGLDLGTTLLFTGVCNILTGRAKLPFSDFSDFLLCYFPYLFVFQKGGSKRLTCIKSGMLFGVPMPVQPMKSIAAAAITPGHILTIPQIMAAGILTGSILVGLGLTGLMTLANRIVPLSVVRGIQLSQGLSFGITAVKYIMNEQNFSKGKMGGKRDWLGLDSKLLAIVAVMFIVLVSGAGEYTVHPFPKDSVERDAVIVDPNPRRKRTWRERLQLIPTALLVFLLGIVLAFIRDPGIAGRLRVGPATPKIVHINAHDWRVGFVKGTIPQLPLSILNSVIAVCKLSNDLFPTKLEVTPMKVSTSVGLMNVVGCWFGAMPACHGCGGLAGQYRFGARTGASVVFLGALKIVIGLLLGSSLLQILNHFPVALLGVLLLFSGLELAMTCRDQNTRTDAFVMLMVTAVSLTNSSAVLGFLTGMVIAVLIKSRDPHTWKYLHRLSQWPKRRYTPAPSPDTHQV